MSSTEITSGVLALVLIAVVLAARELLSRRIHRPQIDPTAEKAKRKFDAKLSSKGLAGLIVQSLIDAKLLSAEKSEEATTVAERKIDLRKALGDY
jgi:hypothetical protein